MTGRRTVILALTPIAEREVEALLFDTADPPLTLLEQRRGGRRTTRAVEQETPDAVLVSPELSGLTARTAQRVRATGARLVGLALDERERDGPRHAERR